MTRRDQMLGEFDSLAVAELDDNYSFEREQPVWGASTQAAAPVEVLRSAFSAWDWIMGLCVVGLVVLAARK